MELIFEPKVTGNEQLTSFSVPWETLEENIRRNGRRHGNTISILDVSLDDIVGPYSVKWTFKPTKKGKLKIICNQDSGQKWVAKTTDKSMLDVMTVYRSRCTHKNMAFFVPYVIGGLDSDLFMSWDKVIKALESENRTIEHTSFSACPLKIVSRRVMGHPEYELSFQLEMDSDGDVQLYIVSSNGCDEWELDKRAIDTDYLDKLQMMFDQLWLSEFGSDGTIVFMSTIDYELLVIGHDTVFNGLISQGRLSQDGKKFSVTFQTAHDSAVTQYSISGIETRQFDEMEFHVLLTNGRHFKTRFSNLHFRVRESPYWLRLRNLINKACSEFDESQYDPNKRS